MNKALVALALILWSEAPANAAEGNHAAFFSESAFLSLAPGETGQFSVGFTNTGDQTWVGGELRTSFPLNNTNASDSGWAKDWPAASVYARQAPAIVAPGGIAYFTYSVVVPLNATGSYSFYGRLVVNGQPLEDWGYYQTATVKQSTFVGGVPNASGPLTPGFTRYNGRAIDASGAGVPSVCVYAGPPSGCPNPALLSDASGYWAVDFPTGYQWTFNFEHPLFVFNRSIATGSTVNVTMLKSGSPPAINPFTPPALSPTPTLAPVTTPVPAVTLVPVPTFPITGSVQITSYPVDMWTVAVFKGDEVVGTGSTSNLFSFNLPSGTYRVKFTPPSRFRNNYGWEPKWWTPDGGSYVAGSNVTLPGNTPAINTPYP